MFCQQCGSPIEAGSLFCSKCGTPVPQDTPAEGRTSESAGVGENSPTEPIQETFVPQQGQAPYGGNIPPQDQTYGFGSPNGNPPYGGSYEPPKKRMSKKAKGLMWGGIGLITALAIAAVLVFVVFAGVAWPLSGNTVQTRFVNEGAKVLAGAFSDFSVLKMPDVGDQPFDLESTISLEGENIGLSSAANVDLKMAYDKQTLGAVADMGILKAKLLLIGDTLYIDSGYGVSGVRFDTDADLSKPMGLKERLESLSKDNGKVDYNRLVEAFMNSIDEKCFEKQGQTFTLELKAADMQNALKAFSKKLKADKTLEDEMANMLKSMGQKDTGVDEMLSQAVAGLDYADFDLIFEIRYDGGAPASLNIDVTDEGETTELSFGYEKLNNGKTITLDVNAEGETDDGTITLTVKKETDGLKLSGSIASSDGTSYDFDGSLNKSGNTLSGSFDLSGDGTDYGTLKFGCTVKPGTLDKAVEEDSRFKIDISDADIQDVESALESSISFSNAGF